jgi:hypothetical protein
VGGLKHWIEKLGSRMREKSTRRKGIEDERTIDIEKEKR